MWHRVAPWLSHRVALSPLKCIAPWLFVLVSVAAPIAQTAGGGAPQQQPPRDASAATKGTASIKGRVITADSSRPIRRVQISASAKELGESRSVSTNSQGVFELTDLPAGRYTLTATRGGYLRLQYGQRRPGEPGRPIQLGDGEKVQSADFALPRTSAIVGRITDEAGDPLPNASIFPMQWKYFRGQKRLVPVPGGATFNRTDDTGQFRISGLEPGEYFVMATTRDSWTDEKNPKEKIGFLPTYSGGTANPSEAMRIKVPIGQDVMVPDFAMIPGRVGTISGTAMSSSGRPLAGEDIQVAQDFTGPGTSMSFGVANAKVAADGTFVLRNVAPGEYKLTVRAAANGDGPLEGATTTVVFSGEDLTGIQLLTTTGGSLRGRVVTDTGEALPPGHKIRLTARAVIPSRTFFGTDADSGRVRDDQTFELTGVFGASQLSVSPLPAGWFLRSIEVNGKDVADTPIEVSDGQRLDGLTVLLTKTLPRVRGTLHDDKGQAADGSAILFPEDSSKWTESSRLIRRIRPDATGTFEFADVIPGEYLVAPVEYVSEGDWQDPGYLETLRDRAKRVRVEERGTAPNIALTLKKGA